MKLKEIFVEILKEADEAPKAPSVPVQSTKAAIDKKKEPGPLLRAAMEKGWIFLDGSTYVGKASDGQEVQIGDTYDHATIEDYLQKYPTPERW